MQNYVMNAFMNSLKACVNECKDVTQILSQLGVCYVMFFYHNPLYFDFLFSRKSIQIRLSSDNSDVPPFELFRKGIGRNGFIGRKYPIQNNCNVVFGSWFGSFIGYAEY